jgi:hypothetical protein
MCACMYYRIASVVSVGYRYDDGGMGCHELLCTPCLRCQCSERVKGAVDERPAIGCICLISGVGLGSQDMITRSTAHIESQSRECPACISWCLLGRLGEGD